jgi:hypothetical protein
VSHFASEPLPVSRIISHSLKHYFASFRAVWYYALIIALTGFLSEIAFYFPAVGVHAAITTGIIASLTIAVCLVLGLSAYAGLVKKMHNQLSGHEQHFDSYFRFGLSRFWPMLGASILAYLAIFSGFMIFVLPGIFLCVALYVYLPLVIVEKKGPLCGFVVSVRLTWGNWWRTLVVLIFFAITYAIVYGLVALLSFILGGYVLVDLLNFHEAIVGSLTRLLAAFLLLPWSVSIALTLLNDFRLREIK